MNKKDIVEEKYLYEYIREMLYSAVISESNLNPNSYYHHNTNYKSLLEILKYGILSKRNYAKLIKKRDLTEKEEYLYSDESYVNGADYISLSKMGLSDLYRDEEEYDAYTPHTTDLLIDPNIKADRRTTNYGNEFLALDGIIPISSIKSIDLRLIKYAYLVSKNNRDYILKNIRNTNYAYLALDKNILDVLEYYNSIIDTCNFMLDNNINIKIREVSDNKKIILDPTLIRKNKKIELKK